MWGMMVRERAWKEEKMESEMRSGSQGQVVHVCGVWSSSVAGEEEEQKRKESYSIAFSGY